MNKRIALFAVISIVFIAGLYHFAGAPLITELRAGNVKSAFESEETKLNLARQLNLSTNLSSMSCYITDSSYFSTKSVCFYSADFGADKVSPAVYASHSKQILSLLRQNSWQVDNQAEYNYSKDKLSDVAYHKNLGPISCNLKIANDSGYGIFVNEYSCSRAISMPDLNFSKKIYGP